MIEFNFNRVSIYAIVIGLLLLYILPQITKVVIVVGFFLFVYLFFKPKRENHLQDILVKWRDLKVVNKDKWDDLKQVINDFLDKENYLLNLLKSNNAEREDVKYAYDGMINDKRQILEYLQYFFVNSDYLGVNKNIKYKMDYIETYLSQKINEYYKKILKKF